LTKSLIYWRMWIAEKAQQVRQIQKGLKLETPLSCNLVEKANKSNNYTTIVSTLVDS
jgi:hypothetical protein